MTMVNAAPGLTAFAEKYVSAERIFNPTAAVYTNWGDEAQTNQKYDYNWVLQSSSTNPNETDGENTYWLEPKRALYYKFDISTLINQGYSLEKAVILMNGPDKQRVRFIDCPDNTLKNGQNYLTVPSHEMKDFYSAECADANIGAAAVKELYPDSRRGDDCAFDITDYVLSKAKQGSFTFMMYPYWHLTTIYFENHAQLYVKMTKPREDIMFINCNEQNILSVSGETGAGNVNITVSDSLGNICFEKNMTMSDDEVYYNTEFDMSKASSGAYTVTGIYDGNTVVKLFNYLPKSSTDGSIYTSVDYGTKTVHVYGTMNQSDNSEVMLTVLRPGYEMWDFTDNEAVSHIEVSAASGGHYDFSFGISGEEGTYAVTVSGMYGEVKSFFTYYPEAQAQIDNEIDKYTTTYYAPWLLNWHMTTEEQLEAKYYGGEAGQMCWSMTISESNPDIMFVGTDTNGIWKSTDGGRHWRSSCSGFDIMGTADIAVDPENENIVYALGSTGTKKYESPYGGIYKSTDCGESWKLIFANYYYRIKNNPIIKFTKRDKNGVRRIFAGGHGVGAGSVYSDDEGATWSQISDIPIEANVRDVLVHDDLILFATGMGLYASYDNGETFEEIGPEAGIDCTAAVNPADPGHWICAARESVYETVDSGASWQLISTADKSIASIRYGIGENPVLYMYLSLEHYPLRYSTDNGRTFITPSKTDTSTEFIHDNWGWGAEPFALHPTDENIVFVSLDGELYKSTDGGKTYFASSSGYSGMRASDFLFDSNDESNVFISFIDRGVVKTVDRGRGESYPAVSYSASEDSTGIRYDGSKTTNALARDPKNPDRIIINIGGASKVLKQSYDNGDNYTIIGAAGNISTSLIEFNDDNPYTIYAGSKISYDDGATWTDSEVTVMAVSPFDGNTVYGIKDNCMARSRDEGRTWEIYSVGLGSISSITPDLFEEGTVYAACYSYIVRIADDGNSEIISPVTAEFENPEGFWCLSVSQNPRNSYHLLAGGTNNSEYGRSGGIYESLDGGKTWRNVKGMPSSRDIWKIEFHPVLPRAYIATSAGTFVYEYEKYSEDGIVITNSSFEVTGGEKEDGRFDVSCSMTVWNSTETPYNAAAVYAVYDRETKRLINVYAENISLGTANNAAVNKTISIGESDVVKIYVWSDELEPLKEKYGWQILKNIKSKRIRKDD